MARKKHKVRAEFKKNRTPRARQKDLTRSYEAAGEDDDRIHDLHQKQSVSGKGELTRKRTVAGAEIVEDASGEVVLPAIDESECVLGRVLRVHGLASTVRTPDGTVRECATRRLLKTLSTDQRHVVAVGDWAWVRPSGETEGIIERVEPRRGVLCRTSRGKQQVLATNIDTVLIVTSAAEPRLKPNLIDRYLVTAERANIEPVVCINKVDLVELGPLQPLIGVYAQMGYRVLMLSATEGWGIDQLRELTAGRSTAVTGQSGVGKSSLLNAIEPGLALRVQTVSGDTNKGRHTTTSAELIPLSSGGFIVDTPGIRQFQIWDVIPEEVAGYFRDIRPFVSHCRYPDCTHTHEDHCMVKDAVADGFVDARRYESYLQIHRGDEA